MENSKTHYYRYQGKVILILRKTVAENVPQAIDSILEKIWFEIEKFAEGTAQSLIRQCSEDPEKFKNWARRELNVRLETQEFQSKKSRKAGTRAELIRRKIAGVNCDNKETNSGALTKREPNVNADCQMVTAENDNCNSDCRMSVRQNGRHIGGNCDNGDCDNPKKYLSPGKGKNIVAPECDAEQPENEQPAGTGKPNINNVIKVTIHTSYEKKGNPPTRTGRCRFLLDAVTGQCIRIER